MDRYRCKLFSVWILLLLGFTTLPMVTAQGPGGAHKIEPLLLDRLATGGTADLIVRFTEQVDLSPQTFTAGNERYVWAGDLNAGSYGTPPDGAGNYTYGCGLLNVYAAGLQNCVPLALGYLDGHVSDAATGSPIEGASVTAVPGGGMMAATDPTGYYTMSLPPNSYDVTASKAGNKSEMVTSRVIVSDTVTSQGFSLTYQGQWMQGPSMCFDLTRFDAEYFPPTQKIYILGGRTGSNSTTGNIYEFDPATEACADTGANMPVPISNYTVNLVHDGANQLLCTFGGRPQGGGTTPEVQCYDPVANSASVVGSLPPGYGTYLPAAQVVVDNIVYVFGGLDPNANPYTTAVTYKYDPVTATWTQLGNLNLARTYIFATAVDGMIYAFGGDTYDGYTLHAQDITEMLDPAGGVWDDAAVADLPQESGEGQAFGYDSNSPHLYAGQVVLAGGGQWPDEWNKVWLYDVASDTYDTTFPDLIDARRNHAGAFSPLCTDDPTDGLPGMWVFGGRYGTDEPPYMPAEYYPLPCSEGPPQAAFSAAPAEGCIPLIVQFIDESSGNPPIDSWYWDFGDNFTSTLQNPVHTYTTDGTYTALLTVESPSGTDSVSDTISAYPPLEASFDYDPMGGRPPLTVYFTSTSLNAVSPTWDFGDGTLGTGDLVSHTYSVSGSYIVVLTVTSPFGCGVDTATGIVQVVLHGLPVAAFSMDPAGGCVPLTVQFTDESSGDPPIHSWHWNFGDGFTSTLPNPTHIFLLDGDHTVLLTVENLSGTDSTSDTVSAYLPAEASFAYSPTAGLAPMTVTFTNTSLYAVNPTWEFGDGASDVGDVVSHTYGLPGSYVVTLSVSSPFDCGDDSTSAPVEVACDPVHAPDFYWTPLTPTLEEEIVFNGIAGGTGPFSFTWRFGDGTAGTGASITHSYATSGTYTVLMTATNCQTATATVSHTVVIVVCEPVRNPDFAWEPLFPVPGQNVAFTAVPRSGGWHNETVDSSGDVGAYSSLALDSEDRPHISFFDAFNQDLKYAWHDGVSWHIETVDSAGDVGRFSSLALDSDNHPHISYLDGTFAFDGDLRYAYYDSTSRGQGRGWQIETVDRVGDAGWFSSLALDSTDHPYISYFDATNSDLKVVHHDGVEWQAETVDSTGLVGHYTSLALDAAGRPHISYHDIGGGSLKYAYNGATGWYTETVDDEGFVGSFTSLALDAAGRPHIAYFDVSNSNLKYAYNDGTGWYTETVDSSGDVGTFVSLALDDEDYPHISYHDISDGSLKYAWYNGIYWHVEVIDSTGNAGPYTEIGGIPDNVGWYTSLAVDASRRLQISYYDAMSTNLRYGRSEAPIPTLPIVFAWDLGDDSFAEGPIVYHRYQFTGTYTVVMTATNVCREAVVTHDITVRLLGWHVYLPLVFKGNNP